MIVYLHGLNSSGRSAKAAWLRQSLAPVPVLSPTYPAHRAEEAHAFLARELRTARERVARGPLLLVGSSLGGFWARAFARELAANLVLINPVVDPVRALARYTGRQRNPATGEEYVLRDADLRALAARRPPRCPDVPTLVLLDRDDEVLDYRDAEAYFRPCARILVYPGGSHAFEHLPEALPEIRALLDQA